MTLASDVRARVWDESGGVCHYCHKELHPVLDFTVDHVIALAIGGTDDAANLVAACKSCNLRKHTKSVDVFLNPPLVPAKTTPPLPPNSLTELRKAKGLTQQQLADMIGVAKNTVTRWEMNKNPNDPKNSIRPGGPAKRLLGIYLECDPDQIIYGSEERSE